MRTRVIPLLVLSMMAPSLMAADFQPSQGACKGVDKEIERVTREMEETTSNIKGEWLKRQKRALETKKSSCSDNGYTVD
ncbi:hypothetical protein DXV75_09845 [Alteromonas aestuariivivens]|uniref:DUF1090 family protein n=1 Tax=Alteromonas aestuariivivens TaxID=1938339 RepID=A0A3D8M724_9ALTE|nr:hypothetical protein [Alteromonas aestuariivivens]RDV25582.1 hypothetical protein DXV75_09845 [Alteromonas aestuariivivens]